MTYHNENLPQYVKTAGKITVVTALAGLLVFMFAFIFDVGTKEFNKVSAGVATTTLTVLNTPPVFTVGAYEVVESSTSTPTNSSYSIQWSAIGTDANAADYYLLICSTNASPTPVNNAAPTCHPSNIQWGVSTATISGTQAYVSTTTTEVAPFGESNDWFAWVCDGDPTDPRCSVIPVQGLSATNSSPFNVNKRPVLSDFDNNGPVDPSGTLTFFSTSSDPDTVPGEDEIYLIVCNSNSFSTSTDTCGGTFIASTTISVLSDASATYTVPSLIRDDVYPAFGFLIDKHGHEALANGLQANFTVNNVPPVVVGADIEIYGNAGPGTDLVVDQPGAETPSSTINFTVTDANSCINAASGSEFRDPNDMLITIFRSGIGSSTCDGSGTNYDPNNCYDSGVATTTWNLSCVASSTCAGPGQDYMDYTCTFPLWFIADPTDDGAVTSPFAAQNWSAGVAGVDDDFATGTMATTSSPKELVSFSSLDVLANEISYGGIEPGQNTGTLSATSTIVNIGNTGLDQLVKGESMCGTFSVATECPVSATSTIPEFEQKFGSSSLAYGSPIALILASTTDQELELDVKKATTTPLATVPRGITYWGIRVPASITLAGAYSGLNTFTAKTAETADW